MTNVIKNYRSLPITLKAAIWFFMCTILQKGMAFIVTPIFTRMMSTEEYGIVSMYNSWSSILVIFATLDLTGGVFNTAMVRFEHERKRYVSAVQGLTTCLTLAMFLLFLVFRDVAVATLDLPFEYIALMFICFLFTPSHEFWATKNRFEYKYISYVIVTMMLYATNLSLSLFLIFRMQDKALARIMGMVLPTAVVGIFFYCYNWAQGKCFYDKNYWIYSLKFNLPLIPHYLSMNVLSTSDRVMISKIVGNSAAGIYSVAYSIGLLLQIVNQCVNKAFIPWQYQKMKEERYAEIRKNTKYILVSLSVCIMGLILCAPEVIAIMAPKEYQAAVWAIPPVAISLVCMLSYSIIVNIEYYFGKTIFVMVASTVSAVANIVLNAIFIPIFGFVAAGYTTLVCYIIYVVAHYVFMQRACRMQNIRDNVFDLKFLGICLALLMFTAAIIMLLYPYRYIRYTVVVAIIFVILLNYKRIKKYYTSFKNCN